VLTSRSYHSSRKSDSLLYYLVLWIMGNGTAAARGVAHLETTASPYLPIHLLPCLAPRTRLWRDAGRDPMSHLSPFLGGKE
jgi:hypothetical protein